MSHRGDGLAATLEAWRRFVDGLPTEAPVRSVILDSWRRSTASGVDPRPGEIRLTRVPEAELEGRLAANAALGTVAAPHVRWTSRALGDLPHVVYLVDRDGIVLDSAGSPQMLDLGLVPGYDWSEARMGTNGSGTALAADQPVAVVACEHFVDAFHGSTCTGAPVHAPGGEVIGAVDITTSAADGRPDRLVLAVYLAQVIEHELKLRLERRDAEARLREAHRGVEQELEWTDRLVDLLSEISSVVDSTESPERARGKIVALVARCLGWPATHIYVRDPATSRLEDAGDWHLETPANFTGLVEALRRAPCAPEGGAAARAAATGEVCWIADLDRCEWFRRATGGRPTGVRTALAIPVAVRGEVAAVAEFFRRDNALPHPQTLRVLSQVGGHLGRLFERRRLQQEIVAAGWRKQRAFGQQLHDLAAQELAALGMRADRLTRHLERAGHEDRGLAAGLAAGIREALGRLRALARGLHPVDVDADAFGAALERLANSVHQLHAIDCQLVQEGTLRLGDHEVAIQLFRIVQEAVANAVRHAGASRIALRVACRPGGVEVAVEDDGVGIPAGVDGPGLGLHIMRYRASFVGASLEVGAAPGRGTLVRCTAPVRSGGQRVSRP